MNICQCCIAIALKAHPNQPAKCYSNTEWFLRSQNKSALIGYGFGGAFGLIQVERKRNSKRHSNIEHWSMFTHMQLKLTNKWWVFSIHLLSGHKMPICNLQWRHYKCIYPRNASKSNMTFAIKDPRRYWYWLDNCDFHLVFVCVRSSNERNSV